MNEKMKEKIITLCHAWSVEYMFEMMNKYAKEIEEEAYLQGAKDMMEAVKPENHASASWAVSYNKGYHQKIIDDFEYKTQNFLDGIKWKKELSSHPVKTYMENIRAEDFVATNDYWILVECDMCGYKKKIMKSELPMGSCNENPFYGNHACSTHKIGTFYKVRIGE